MTDAGISGKITCYVVPSSNDPPSNLATLITNDYSFNLIRFDVTGRIGQLRTLNATMMGIDVDPNILRAGSLMYILSGKKLVGKFVIDSPQFNREGTITVTGIQSTGTRKSGVKLHNNVSPKSKFENMQLCNITKCISDIAFDWYSICDPTDTYTIRTDNNNAFSEIQTLAVRSQKELNITHGTNPFTGGDRLELLNRVGNSSSVKTFDVSGSTQNVTKVEAGDDENSMINHVILKGTSRNGAQIESEMYDATLLKTKLTSNFDGWLYEDLKAGQTVLEFTGLSGQLRVGDTVRETSTGLTVTLIDLESRSGTTEQWGVNGFLSGSISYFFTVSNSIEVKRGDGTIITGTFNAYREVLGSCNTIKIHKNSGLTSADGVGINNELIDIDRVVTTNPDYDVLYVLGPQNGSSSLVGRNRLIVTPHRKGTDVWNFSTSMTLQVQSTSGFATSGTRSVRVGNEVMEYTAQSANTFTVKRSLDQKPYSHGKDIYVTQHERDGTTYTPTTPRNDNCSINVKGLRSKPLNEYGSMSLDDLDRKAQAIVYNRNKTKRVTITPAEHFTTFDDVNLGDTVTVSNGSSFNVTDGLYRVMGFKYYYNMGLTELKLYLNDNETRIYSNTETSFIENLEEVNENKYTAFSRFLDGDRFSFGKAYDVALDLIPDEWNLINSVRIGNVLDPTEPFDVVNLKTLNNELNKLILPGGGAGGESLWCGGGTGFIRPCNVTGIRVDCVTQATTDNNIKFGNNLYPATSTCQTLGLFGCYWKEIWGNCISATNFVGAPCVDTNSLKTLAINEFAPGCFTSFCTNITTPNNTYDIGGSLTRFKTVYACCFCGNVTNTWVGAGTGWIRPLNNCGLTLCNNIQSGTTSVCIGVPSSPGNIQVFYGCCGNFIKCVCSPCGNFPCRLILPVGCNMYG